MKKRHTFLKYFILIITIINVVLAINMYNMSKHRGYYTGKIESISQKDGITTVEVSSVSSNRYFISEIKANHQIKYADNIGISGLSAQEAKTPEDSNWANLEKWLKI